MAGLSDLAAIDALMKNLKTIRDTLEADIKDQMVSYFVENGCEAEKRPENFRGIDGNLASASCELRARSSASALTAAEQSICEEFGIGTRVNEIIADTYIINPAYATDENLMNKIVKKLNTISGLPEDFLLKQDGFEKIVPDENAIEKFFSLPEEDARTMIRIVGTLAIKPKFSGELSQAIDLVKEVLDNDDENDDA